ncbi:MAG: hypothetical protein U5L75_03780 [Candidatus Campbellbacteria bacterium]|nr:hypothetical protein [Candidatus Campbellbacteria bacterium]
MSEKTVSFDKRLLRLEGCNSNVATRHLRNARFSVYGRVQKGDNNAISDRKKAAMYLRKVLDARVLQVKLSKEEWQDYVPDMLEHLFARHAIRKEINGEAPIRELAEEIETLAARLRERFVPDPVSK